VAVINELDLREARERLAVWLGTKLPNAEDVAVSEVTMPGATGMSQTTLFFEASVVEDGREKTLDLVARVAPVGPGLLKHNDLAREFELMGALAERTPVAVPRPRWFEADASVFGSPFIVMDRAHGEVPADDPPYTVAGWALELSPEGRAAMCKHGLEVLAQIHAVDWKGLGLGFLDRPEFGPTGIEQQIAYWEDSYAWAADGMGSATIDEGLAWAKANKPIDEELVLSWGDARLGNLVFEPAAVTVEAVLDWEMATIASPEMDLGWHLFVPRFYTEGIGAPLAEGFLTREQLVAGYEERTGRTVRHVDFYEAFAALRLAIVMLRVGRLMIDGGAMPPDSPMPFNNPPSQLLSKLTGVVVPDGDAEYPIGNR
jgi:aminoglycoside phosphotransferase (APT) family kinase protein